MEKKFKPFDKVLIRGIQYWECSLYNFYDKEAKLHTVISTDEYIHDDNILPYEGNEELVGTSDEPETEVKLDKGEWVMVCDDRSILPENWKIRRYDGTDSSIRVFNNSSASLCAWKYAIRFSDFNPNDMEETRRYILVVKNGKIIKYKG